MFRIIQGLFSEEPTDSVSHRIHITTSILSLHPRIRILNHFPPGFGFFFDSRILFLWEYEFMDGDSHWIESSSPNSDSLTHNHFGACFESFDSESFWGKIRILKLIFFFFWIPLNSANNSSFDSRKVWWQYQQLYRT